MKFFASFTQVVRRLGTVKQTYYLTTPIFYVNAKPHIGHLYTTLLADAVARHQTIMSTEKQVLFMTGTDEHGLKIQNAAKSNSSSEEEYVKHVSNMYRDLFSIYGVSNTDFLRTTENRHAECVKSIWTTLNANGYIYQGKYSGWYCTVDEAFVPESQLVTLPDATKVTIDGMKPVEFIKENNYKFRLSSFKKQLLDWLQGDVIRPGKFKKIVIDWVEEESVLTDLSISRPRSRVWWGIPVPNDPDQSIYVWLDALSCYLSSAGYPKSLKYWPPNLQIIGKDILKFHAVYWPAFLMALDLPPPRQILCHSHWLIDDKKMSKSRGNVVDPKSEAEKFTTEGLRYFLLREGVPHTDGNYSTVKVQRILNAELADTLGNLLSRCSGALVNPQQIVPPFIARDHERYCFQSSQQLLTSLEALPDVVDDFYSNYNFYKGIDEIMAVLRLANGFLELEKPWELRKNPESLPHLFVVLSIAFESLRVCGILLYPIVPEMSSKLLSKLNVAESKRKFANIKPILQANCDVKLSTEKSILFQRLK